MVVTEEQLAVVLVVVEAVVVLMLLQPYLLHLVPHTPMLLVPLLLIHLLNQVS